MVKYMVNTDKAEKKVFCTRTIKYGTINNLEVNIHTYNGGYTVDSILRDFVRAYIDYMTRNALLSDDVLFSSISARDFKQAVICGARENFVVDSFYSAFVKNIKESWEMLVLTERYGFEQGYRKYLINDLGHAKADEVLKVVFKN